MKVRWLFYFIIIFVSLLFIMNPIMAKANNHQNWTQYRLNSENNPVLKIDALKEVDRTIKTTNEIRSTPVVVDNKVYVGNHDSGDLYAFKLETGELLWKNKAPNWIHSEMIYVNDQLFVGYGNRFFQDNGIRGTGDSGLLSLDPGNGEILWDFQTEGEVMPTPTYYNGTVYITTGDKHLYGVDPEDGTEKWSINLGSVVSMSAPNIKDGVLYVGGSTPYKFFAVDLAERTIKWEREFEEVTSGMDDVPPVVSKQGIVYTTGVQDTNNTLSIRKVYDKRGPVASYKQMVKLALGNVIGKSPLRNYEHKLYAIDIENGDIKWEKSLGEGQMVSNNKSGAPMLYDDKVFVGSPITKSFYAYDANSGEQLWKYKSNINKAPPVADNDVVYFTDIKGLVYGFNVDSGELLGKKLLGGKLAPSGPIIVNDHLVVGSQDSNVYAVLTDDVLQAGDSVEEDNNLLSYIFLVYVLPICILLPTFVIAIVGVRFSIKKMKEA